MAVDRPRVLDDCRRTLAGVTRDKPVRVFRAETDQPRAERPGLAGLPARRVVILAIPRCVVAIELENISQTALRRRNERVVAGTPDLGFHHAGGRDPVDGRPGDRAIKSACPPTGRRTNRSGELSVREKSMLRGKKQWAGPVRPNLFWSPGRCAQSGAAFSTGYSRSLRKTPSWLMIGCASVT